MSRCQLEGKVYPWVNGKKWKGVEQKADMKREGPASKKKTEKPEWRRKRVSE